MVNHEDSPRMPQERHQHQSSQKQQQPRGPQGRGSHQGGPGQFSQQSPGSFQGQAPPGGQSQPPGQFQSQPPSGRQSQAPPGQQASPPTGQQHQSPTGSGGHHGPAGPQMGPQSSMGTQGPPRSTPPQSMGAGPGMGTQPPTHRGRPSLDTMDVEDVAQDEVYAVEPDTQVSQIVEEMDQMNVGTAVVVEDDKPVDIITDRSIALALSDNPNLAEQTADELVEEDLITVSNDTEVFEVLSQMRDAGVRRIPIVDDQGELEGIVSIDDILLLLEDQLSSVTDVIEEQYPDI